MSLEIIITAIIIEKIILGTLVYKVWTADNARHNAVIAAHLKNLPYNECPICLEEFKKTDIINMLTCNHCYHSHCISNWKLYEKNGNNLNAENNKNPRGCPMCRQKIIYKSKKNCIGE